MDEEIKPKLQPMSEEAMFNTYLHGLNQSIHDKITPAQIDRIEGIIRIEYFKKFNESVVELIKDIIDEGFDLPEAVNYLEYRIKIAANSI